MRARKTVWLVRGHEMCKCGCGGACTTDAIQVEMNRSFNLLQHGIYATERLDGRDWDRSDWWRKLKSGDRLPLIGCLCEYRGDMPERCAKAQTKGHMSNHGCQCCTATRDDMHTKYNLCGMYNIPWQIRDHTCANVSVKTCVWGSEGSHGRTVNWGNDLGNTFADLTYTDKMCNIFIIKGALTNALLCSISG